MWLHLCTPSSASIIEGRPWQGLHNVRQGGPLAEESLRRAPMHKEAAVALRASVLSSCRQGANAEEGATGGEHSVFQRGDPVACVRVGRCLAM